jgi:predicted XRE-type DNA-binding protein
LWSDCEHRRRRQSCIGPSLGVPRLRRGTPLPQDDTWRYMFRRIIVFFLPGASCIEKGRVDTSMRTTKRTQPKRIRTEKSSGNVFADLGLPHPGQELLKARLTLQIYRLIKGRGLKQAEAGKILGIKQPHVSALMRNRSGSFSVERLMEFLTALGQDVEITVRPTRKQHGEMSVVA